MKNDGLMGNTDTGAATTPAANGNAAILTEREKQVLTLVADGLTNGEIGVRMSVSEKTVKSHVSNILTKLHLSDRTQAAVFAWRQGLTKR